VIAIVSSNRPERVAFATLCDSYKWHALDLDSARLAIRQFNRFLPKVIILRHKLSDGYSDDVMPKIRLLPGGTGAKIIVLVDAAQTSSAEARQLRLGADCVQRDPIRSEILAAYIEKFLATHSRRFGDQSSSGSEVIKFAGARLSLDDRVLHGSNQHLRISPKEAELAESLFHARGTVIRYEVLYDDVLGRKFAGDTSNMRVLLGKLSTSFRHIGINLRHWIEVIPKTGYRLSLGPEVAPRKSPSQPKSRKNLKSRQIG